MDNGDKKQQVPLQQNQHVEYCDNQKSGNEPPVDNVGDDICDTCNKDVIDNYLQLLPEKELASVFDQVAELLSSNLIPKSFSASVDLKLQLYALYKQATVGDFDIKTTKALWSHLKAAMKQNAWKELIGLPSNQARIQYIQLVIHHLSSLDDEIVKLQLKTIVSRCKCIAEMRNTSFKLQELEGTTPDYLARVSANKCLLAASKDSSCHDESINLNRSSTVFGSLEDKNNNNNNNNNGTDDLTICCTEKETPNNTNEISMNTCSNHNDTIHISLAKGHEKCDQINTTHLTSICTHDKDSATAYESVSNSGDTNTHTNIGSDDFASESNNINTVETIDEEPKSAKDFVKEDNLACGDYTKTGCCIAENINNILDVNAKECKNSTANQFSMSNQSSLKQDKDNTLLDNIWECCIRLQSFVPRGRLDISYNQLGRALFSCLRESLWCTGCDEVLLSKIESHFLSSGHSNHQHLVVGLAVRSLLDLYLLVQRYPPGSEIIMTPPINVPGMVKVLRDHHQIEIVPIDLPENNLIAVDVDAVERAITKQTKAILVVHPFGMISASKDDMKKLQSLCLASSMHLLEDCAECYTGLTGADCYLGSPYADLTFISFGLIKTATAIGGGIVTSNNRKLLQQMQRLQQTFYTQQSTLVYMTKIFKALLLNIIADLPLISGLLAYTCALLGADYNFLVTTSLRGFSSRSGLAEIRQRPCVALLNTLHHRLCFESNTLESTTRRIQLGQTLSRLFQSKVIENETIQLLNTKKECTKTHWLFPISHQNAKKCASFMRWHGIDTTSGSSQLMCISDNLKCPRAYSMMHKIVFLPVSGRSVNLNYCNKLTNLLQTYKDNSIENIGCILATLRFRFGILLLVCLGMIYPGIVTSLTMTTLQFTFACSLTFGCCAYCLTFHLGSDYVKSSTAFTSNHDALTAEDGTHSTSGGTDMKDIVVLESIDALNIPKRVHRDSHNVLLTGATGFVGSMILRDLLFHCEHLKIGKIFVLCRAKRGTTAKERIREHLQKTIYQSLEINELQSIVYVVEGDVTKHDAGLEGSDLEAVLSTVSHIFHCAASVSFTQSLSDAARVNIESALLMQKLTAKCAGGQCIFVHISTAFVHGDLKGSKNEPLPQTLFPLNPYDPLKAYHSMKNTEYYASQAMHDLGFPNTYTFSKCICEHLLLRSRTKTIIFRPSVVSPAIERPYGGWGGDKPSTLIAAACLYTKMPWTLWPFSKDEIPAVPVDVVSRFVIRKSFFHDCRSAENSVASSYTDDFERIDDPVNSDGFSDSSMDNESLIYNVTCNYFRSQEWTWFHFAGSVLQVGAVSGHFSRLCAYIQMLFYTKIWSWIELSFDLFVTIHNLCVRQPTFYVTRLLSSNNKQWQTFDKYSQFIDLPVLFFPFMRKTFVFESEIDMPPSFDVDRYSVLCASTAISFVAKDKSLIELQDDYKFYSVAGLYSNIKGSSLCWALCQPFGSLITRLTAFITRCVLNKCFDEVLVDIQSFAQIKRKLKEIDGNVKIVLLPTHRSFLDFILISFVIFSVPELQLEMPYILAADEFQRIPFLGKLLKWLRVLFVKRGRGRKDPTLFDKLSSIKPQQSSNVCFEMYIEGTRSRDGRINKAKTGALKCFESLEGTCLYVPITINYELTPDFSDLTREAGGENASGLHLCALFNWLKAVWKGQILLGRAHIIACDPIVGKQLTSIKSLVMEIQKKQSENRYFSTYHVTALARFLDLHPDKVRAGCLELGCHFLPLRQQSTVLGLSCNQSELCAIGLPLLQYLVPLIKPANNKWIDWLSTSTLNEHKVQSNMDAQDMANAFTKLLDRIDQLVEKEVVRLLDSRIDIQNTSFILEKGAMNCGFPNLLIRAALSFHTKQLPTTLVEKINNSSSIEVIGSQTQHGKWGFDDTKFVMRVSASGERFVVLTGDRYELAGKSLKRLVPFMEHETKTFLNPSIINPQAQSTINRIECQLSQDGLIKLKDSVTVVSTSLVERTNHGGGQSLIDVSDMRSHKLNRIPDAVIWPGNETEIIAVVELAKSENWCLIPFGGGTNVSSATRCPPIENEPRPIISVNMTKLNRVLWINEEDGLAKVEAGITGRQLQEELKVKGYTLGHEPDSIEFSTLGGWIATMSSGMKRNIYGNIEDIVKSVRMVGSDGVYDRICADGTMWGRESANIQLPNILMGSEGCLGIISNAVVRIWPLPAATEYDSFLFANFEKGLSFCRQVSRLRANLPASCRLMDNTHFRFGQALQPECQNLLSSFQNLMQRFVLDHFIPFDINSVVCATICYEGSHEEVRNQKRCITSMAKESGGIRLGSKVGKASNEMTFMIAYLRDFALDYHFLGESFETFSPWSRIEQIILATKQRIRKEHKLRHLPGEPFIGCRVTQLYHEGVCLYFYFCTNLEKVPNQSAVFSEIERAARDTILENGGSLSHHHGVGKVRSSFISRVDTKSWLDTKKSIKNVIDPNNIFGARNGSYV